MSLVDGSDPGPCPGVTVLQVFHPSPDNTAVSSGCGCPQPTHALLEFNAHTLLQVTPTVHSLYKKIVHVYTILKHTKATKQKAHAMYVQVLKAVP